MKTLVVMAWLLAGAAVLTAAYAVTFSAQPANAVYLANDQGPKP